MKIVCAGDVIPPTPPLTFRDILPGTTFRLEKGAKVMIKVHRSRTPTHGCREDSYFGVYLHNGGTKEVDGPDAVVLVNTTLQVDHSDFIPAMATPVTGTAGG